MEPEILVIAFTVFFNPNPNLTLTLSR